MIKYYRVVKGRVMKEERKGKGKKGEKAQLSV